MHSSEAALDNEPGEPAKMDTNQMEQLPVVHTEPAAQKVDHANMSDSVVSGERVTLNEKIEKTAPAVPDMNGTSVPMPGAEGEVIPATQIESGQTSPTSEAHVLDMPKPEEEKLPVTKTAVPVLSNTEEGQHPTGDGSMAQVSKADDGKLPTATTDALMLSNVNEGQHPMSDTNMVEASNPDGGSLAVGTAHMPDVSNAKEGHCPTGGPKTAVVPRVKGASIPAEPTDVALMPKAKEGHCPAGDSNKADMLQAEDRQGLACNTTVAELPEAENGKHDVQALAGTRDANPAVNSDDRLPKEDVEDHDRESMDKHGECRPSNTSLAESCTNSSPSTLEKRTDAVRQSSERQAILTNIQTPRSMEHSKDDAAVLAAADDSAKRDLMNVQVDGATEGSNREATEGSNREATEGSNREAIAIDKGNLPMKDAASVAGILAKDDTVPSESARQPGHDVTGIAENPPSGSKKSSDSIHGANNNSKSASSSDSQSENSHTDSSSSGDDGDDDNDDVGEGSTILASVKDKSSLGSPATQTEAEAQLRAMEEEEPIEDSDLRAVNEQDVQGVRIERPDVKLTESHVLKPVGKISSVMAKVVIVMTPAAAGATAEDNATPIPAAREDETALDDGTPLWFVDRTLLGAVYETMGPVAAPVYMIRFNSAVEIEEAGAKVGREVFCVEEMNHTVRAKDVRVKGYDSSNVHDEEASGGEEFSDDEMEKQARRARKRGSSNDELTDRPHGGAPKRGRGRGGIRGWDGAPGDNGRGGRGRYGGRGRDGGQGWHTRRGGSRGGYGSGGPRRYGEANASRGGYGGPRPARGGYGNPRHAHAGSSEVSPSGSGYGRGQGSRPQLHAGFPSPPMQMNNGYAAYHPAPQTLMYGMPQGQAPMYAMPPAQMYGMQQAGGGQWDVYANDTAQAGPSQPPAMGNMTPVMPNGVPNGMQNGNGGVQYGGQDMMAMNATMMAGAMPPVAMPGGAPAMPGGAPVMPVGTPVMPVGTHVMPGGAPPMQGGVPPANAAGYAYDPGHNYQDGAGQAPTMWTAGGVPPYYYEGGHGGRGGRGGGRHG